MSSPRVRWLLFTALLGFALLLLLQPGAPALIPPLPPQATAVAQETAEPALVTVYSEGIAGRPQNINPLLSDFNDADQDLTALIFSGLTTTEGDGSSKPALAESWEISPDGLNYTFYLRQGAKWHDGTLFTSRDVSATISLLQATGFPAPPALSDFWKRVVISTPGDYTVTFTLNEPYAPFLSYTSLGILPARVVEQTPPTSWPSQAFASHPIGTGPFRVKQMDQANGTVVLEPFADFYGPKPKISRLELHFYPTEYAALAAYQSGNVLGVAHIPTDKLADARRMDSLQLFATTSSGFNAFYLNLRNPLFQQKEVRQALMLALDRQRIVDRALDGQGIVAHSPIPPNSWAYNRYVKKYAQDIDAAKQIMAQAGWKETDGVLQKGSQKMDFAIMSSDEPAHVQVIEEVSREWAAIGVKAHPQTSGFAGVARDFLRTRTFDTIYVEWRDPSADPDLYALWHSTRISDEGQNYASWQNRDADELLEQARSIPDPQRRAQLYATFQDLFADQIPAILISYPVYVYGVDKRVQNVQVGPLTRAADRFRTIANWTVEAK